MTDIQPLETLTVGDRHEAEIVLGPEAVADFAQLSGDDNPLHVDRAAARRLGFNREVAHGAILLAELSRIIGTELPGPGSLWLSSEIDFTAPVYVGDHITVAVEVEHVSLALDIVLLAVHAYRSGSSQAVLRGQAKVKVLKDFAPMTHIPLEDQHVLVTGGTQGLGAAVTRFLADQGARVTAVYRSNDGAAEEFAGAVDAEDRLTVQRCDVADPDAVQALFAGFDPTTNPVHGFVHAASPRPLDIAFEELEWAHVAPFLETGVRGAFEVVQRCLPHFEALGTGRVVLVGSEATVAPRKGWTPYVTGKGALTGLSRALAVELPKYGATVNLVAPGLLHTSDVLPDNVKSMTRNATPLKRLVSEEEVAEVIGFLLGRGGSFMNGATLPMTGGRIFFS